MKLKDPKKRWNIVLKKVATKRFDFQELYFAHMQKYYNLDKDEWDIYLNQCYQCTSSNVEFWSAHVHHPKDYLYIIGNAWCSHKCSGLSEYFKTPIEGCPYQNGCYGILKPNTKIILRQHDPPYIDLEPLVLTKSFLI